MFAFITASPIVFMAEFGLSQAVYSASFFTAGLGTIAGSIVSGRLKSGHWAIRAGAWIGTGCTALTVFVCSSNWSGAWTSSPSLFLSNACYGSLGPHASHDASVPMGSMAGIASAVLRSCQMSLGAVAGSVAVALAPLGPAVGMSSTMFAAASASSVSIRLRRELLRQPVDEDPHAGGESAPIRPQYPPPRGSAGKVEERSSRSPRTAGIDAIDIDAHAGLG
ncbi:hypothetical protein OY671_008048, partial [Metschnikowia pulcherrima]